MYRDLDHVETCGFLHGVQHVPNNTFEVFSDIANFWPFLLYFMGVFGKLLEMEQNWVYLIEQASGMSKITLSVIFYAPCLNKTTIKSNKKKFCWHFFLDDPLLSWIDWILLSSICILYFSVIHWERDGQAASISTWPQIWIGSRHLLSVLSHHLLRPLHQEKLPQGSFWLLLLVLYVQWGLDKLDNIFVFNRSVHLNCLTNYQLLYAILYVFAKLNLFL